MPHPVVGDRGMNRSVTRLGSPKLPEVWHGGGELVADFVKDPGADLTLLDVLLGGGAKVCSGIICEAVNPLVASPMFVFSSVLGLLLSLVSLDLGRGQFANPRYLEEACVLGPVIVREGRRAECLNDRLAVTDKLSGRRVAVGVSSPKGTGCKVYSEKFRHDRRGRPAGRDLGLDGAVTSR
jgi:hypothetical protein